MSDSFEENQDIQEVKIEDSMRASYLDYSMSVIVGRALPDARDGLKPVHRRILFAMNELNLSHRSPYKKSARIVGDCLVAGSLVSTTRGLVPIEDIEVGDKVYTQKGIKPVTELFYQPEQPLLKVTSSSNIFENRVTHGHKFKVLNSDLTYSFKSSSELTTDDYLIMQPSLIDLEDSFDKDEVYALGLFMSDGNIDRDRDLNYACFSNSEENILANVKETFNLKNTIFDSKTTKILKVSNKKKSQAFLEKFDVSDKYSHNIDINSTIMSFSNTSLLSFLSGFIDGDGFVRNRGTNEMVITSVSHQFLQKLAILLFDRFGVVSNINLNKSKDSKSMFNGQEINANYDAYNLTFTGSNAYFFKDKLNLLNEKKRSRLEAFKVSNSPSLTSHIPFFGEKIFNIFSEKHIGSGWYQLEDGEKFRLGIKYKNGTKIRYAKELPKSIKIYSDTLEELNILEKLHRLDGKLHENLKHIVDSKIRFLKVNQVENVSDEITYDFTVQDEHEFFVNGVVSSNCIGKYHPHGDNSVYDALVRMAQDFSLRSPLIDGQGNFGSVDGDNAAAMRYCVTGNTRVKTDKGLIKIEELVQNTALNSDNDLDIKVLSMAKREHGASKLFNSGIHDIYELKTKEGFNISGSANHLVLTLTTDKDGKPIYDWKRLEQVGLEDKIVIDRSEQALFDRTATKSEKNLAIIAGCLVSEGCMSANRIGFNNTDKNYFDNFIKAWESEFGESFYLNQRELPSGKTIYEFDLHLDHSKDREKIFESDVYLQMQGLKSKDKRVPNFIFSMPKEAQKIFVEHIKYSTMSKGLAEDIQILLLEFGIVGNIEKLESRDEYQITETGVSQKKNISSFAEFGGFFSKQYEKKAITSEFYSNVKRDVNTITMASLQQEFLSFVDNNYYYASVDSCKKTGEQEAVYSIRVDSDCHSFVANGLINHNTEARMTKIAEELLRDLDKDTVDFTANYDDSMTEPDVFPSRIPNLLLNGSSGIAVGMATNIPPHRMDELMEALLHIIDNPDCEDSELLSIVKGPDFPTGGIIFGKKGITDAYTTGRGRIKVRAKTHIEENKNREVIVVDELPYQVNKSRLIENIAHLVRDKQVEGISEIRDESDREGMRIVIELKRDAMSDIVLNNLFKSTQMQVTFGIIMLAIENKEPKVFKLRELLDLFLKHRKTVIIRRTIFELEKAKSRAHILEGLKIAVDNIDGVISIIRESPDTENAKLNLMQKFSLKEIQSSAILEMKLRRLTGLEREKIENELNELYKLIDYLQSILKSEEILNGIITDELKEIAENFKAKRRTEIVDDYDDIDIEDLIPNEPMVVTITHRGYIKRVAVKQYEKQKRGGKGKIAVTTHDDDFIEQFFTSSTHDTLMFVTNMGQLYWLKVYRIPEGSRTAKGKAVVNLINLKPDEKIMSIIPTTDFEEDKGLVFFTKKGIVKRTNLKEYSNIRTNGVKAINLDEDDAIVTAKIVMPETQWLFLTTKKGQCIRFKVEDAREIGRVARGVTGIKFKIEDDFVCGGITIADEESELLMLSEKGIGKRTTASEYREQSRAGKGVISMKLSSKTGDVVGVVLVEDNKDMMCLTSIGKMIRVDMESIRKAGRNTSGVKVVNVEKKDIVVSMAKCPKEEKDELESTNNEVLEPENK